jgi:hypothetical protein
MISSYQSLIGRAVEDLFYYEVLAGVRMSLVILHTIERLVAMRRLGAHHRSAGIGNPIVAALARMLRLNEPAVGAEFEDFMRAVSAR